MCKKALCNCIKFLTLTTKIFPNLHPRNFQKNYSMMNQQYNTSHTENTSNPTQNNKHMEGHAHMDQWRHQRVDCDV